MSCTLYLCQAIYMEVSWLIRVAPNVTLTVATFCPSRTVLGIGRPAFFSQLSANSETPYQ